MAYWISTIYENKYDRYEPTKTTDLWNHWAHRECGGVTHVWKRSIENVVGLHIEYVVGLHMFGSTEHIENVVGLHMFGSAQ